MFTADRLPQISCMNLLKLGLYPGDVGTEYFLISFHIGNEGESLYKDVFPFSYDICQILAEEVRTTTRLTTLK